MPPKRRSKNPSGSKEQAKKAKLSIPANSLFFNTLGEAGLSVHSEGCKLSHEGSTFQQKLSKSLASEESVSEFVASMEESLEDEQLFFCCLLPTEVSSSSEEDLFPSAVSANQLQVGLINELRF